MLTKNASVTQALEDFSDHFHHAAFPSTTGNYVSSPLGAWLLVVMLASPSPQRFNRLHKDKLERSLGMSIELAREKAVALLANLPDTLKASAKTWIGRAYAEGEPGLAAWFQDSDFQGGASIPSQAEINAWCNEVSQGMIPVFPADISPDIMLLAANILSVDIKWATPFTVVEPEGNMTSWGQEKVLLATNKDHDISFHRDTDGALYAAVTERDATGEISVSAVIAADPDATAERVLLVAEQFPTLRQVALEDLPRSSRIHSVIAKRGLRDTVKAHLPAWEASSFHDLLKIDVGVPAALENIVEGAFGLESAQAAVAKYNASGFKAAAVTYAIMRAASFAPPSDPIKEVTVHFAHPFAVVARVTAAGEWDGIPVFTAWVQEAVEAVEAD